MQKRVEPPVLLSRLMTFVLATAIVVLGVLAMTLANMFPLNRPQIFFLTTEVRDNLDVKLIEMPPVDNNLEDYKMAFVREYVRHRNEVFTNPVVMQSKWNAEDGIVRKMSTDDVYKKFAETDMFFSIMSGMPGFDFQCPVNFMGAPVYMSRDDAYQVKIRYFCTDNNTGQTIPKDYTIKIVLDAGADKQIKWVDRIENPLGLRVSEYTIVEGDGDPLSTGFRTTEQM